MTKQKRILVIAESDSSGIAGIQGDIKTILALGGYALTAVSAITVQGRDGFSLIEPVAPRLVAEQMKMVLNAEAIDAIKIGFLPDAAAVNAVADILDRVEGWKIPVVVDPSIVSRTGKVLVDDDAIAAWKRRLYIHAGALTPNLREAQLLGTAAIRGEDDMNLAASMMRTLGVENVVLKAGRIESDEECYFVASSDGDKTYRRPTVSEAGTLGAGGAFSSAVAVFLAEGMPLSSAIEKSLDFLHHAIVSSPGAKAQEGSINHTFNMEESPVPPAVEKAKIRHV